MSGKKKGDEPPAKKPIAPAAAKDTPEQVLENAPLDVLMDVLAKISGELQGKNGQDLKKHVTTVKMQVETLVQRMEINEEEHLAKKAIAGEVEKLLDSVVRTGSIVGQAVDKQRQPIATAFRGVDLNRMADGLRVFADWLQNPTDAGKVKVEKLVEDLQRTMGPAIGHDPEREEAERKAEIKATVKASLDKIFRPEKKP